ncbi:MAG TPA: DoxX family protein [Anaeromyxobacteraceae bacterium]|nr:DoxX family protein [Anaeromyxobacteraceae bacterium]
MKLDKYWPLPLRVMMGLAFLAHGLPKLGAGHAVFAQSVQQLGIPAPGFFSFVATLVEILGGVALIAGAFVSVATVLLVLEMLVAMFLVHLPHGFNFVNITGVTSQGPQFGMPGAEVNLLYIAGLLALLLGGPGPFSVDERVWKPESPMRLPWRHEVRPKPA